MNGNLGGLTGADAICQGLADGVGLGGTFQAWLGDSSDSPSTRSSQAGPYLRTDGSIAADDWVDLTDGSLDLPISLDENGIARTGSAWSNIAAVGAVPESGTAHCSDWTSGTAGGGRRGSVTATDATWTEIGSGVLCDVPSRLYCIEQ